MRSGAQRGVLQLPGTELSVGIHRLKKNILGFTPVAALAVGQRSTAVFSPLLVSLGWEGEEESPSRSGFKCGTT